MAEQVVFNLTSRDGITLNTKGTYCDKDIAVIPKIEGLIERVVVPKPRLVFSESDMNSLLDTGETGWIFEYDGPDGTYEHGAIYMLERKADG